MEKQKLTIEKLRTMRESENHVEFKKCKEGNMAFNGGSKPKPADRRKCILGYVVALANEGGGYLVLGLEDAYPHNVVGTKQNLNSLGELESKIYNELGIRTFIYEIFDKDGNRVVVIDVPSRPVGIVYTFEDVPLMRVGEDLLPMDQRTLLAILQEHEPDFSQMFCDDVTIDDLDHNAIRIIKEKYSRKQKNPAFISLPDQQALNDLKLIVNGKVTNAAVLLVGKEEIIATHFPQAKVMHEYRNVDGQERFDKRIVFGQPFYILIDKLWETIDARNGNVPVQEGPYLFDIPFFNEQVIREVVNNAFAHRNYRIGSEIVVKQYPNKLCVISPGGFPLGVTLNNMLTVSSTPRNRLLADVLAKTGIVERSGQGMDIIFRLTLSEGKQKPDYEKTDDYQVTAILSAVVKEPAFALFIQAIQQELPENQKLSVFDIMTFSAIREGKQPWDKDIAKRLYELGYLEKRGKTSAVRYIMPRRYYELTGNMTEYSNLIDWDDEQVWAVLFPYLNKYGKAKKTDISKLLMSHISDSQLRRVIERFTDKGLIIKSGKTVNTVYTLSPDYLQRIEVLNQATKIGLTQMLNGNIGSDGINDGTNVKSQANNEEKRS